MALQRVLLAVDQTKPFTIGILGEGLAQLARLWIRCVQVDGSWITFDVLAGEAPVAAPGVNYLEFHMGDITVQNVGELAAILFIRVVDQFGVELYYAESPTPVAVGDLIANTSFFVDMPQQDYTITVEVGH